MSDLSKEISDKNLYMSLFPMEAFSKIPVVTAVVTIAYEIFYATHFITINRRLYK